MINTFKCFMEVTKYSSTITYFLFFYDHVLIQEQNYGHVSNNTCLLSKCRPANDGGEDDDDDVY